MPSCIVRGCYSSWKRSEDVTLHVFPNNKEIIKSWLRRIPQDFGDIDDFAQKVLEGKRSDSYRICSRHFTPWSYHQVASGWRRSLRKDAAPTIFEGTSSAAPRPQKIRCKKNKGRSSEKKGRVSSVKKTDNWTMTDPNVNRRSVETQVVTVTSRGVQCDLDMEPQPLIGLSYMDSLGFMFGATKQ